MNRPTLVFDLGRVLLHIRYNRFLESLGLDHALDEKMLLDRMRSDGHLFESGKISSRDFLERLRRVLGVRIDEKRFQEAWYTILDGEIEGMRDIVERLSQQGPLYLLSNTNDLHFEYAVRTFPILGYFKDYFVSYKVGWMKPSPQIYRHVVQSTGVKPENLFFIDDMEKNVEGAKKEGWGSRVFDGPIALKAILNEMGFSV